ncbi:MAG: DUF2520 domain-containing protein [Saprospiraceae bacterium]
MASSAIPSIGLIGAGRLATVLAKHLIASNIPINWIYSRGGASAKLLANELEIHISESIEDIASAADIIFIAVNDDSIEGVASELRAQNSTALLLHCSGSTSIQALGSKMQRSGIFYPLQSFSKDQAPDFASIPICIDANDNKDLEILISIANQLNCKHYRLDDDARLHVHLAAVFANNFSNALFAISKEILDKNNLPFDILRPLIEETARKIKSQEPLSAQTGPALRGDIEVINRHLQLLESDPNWASIYREMSQIINPELNIPK